MDKIKVLMVAGSMHVGGIENQLMHVARNADKDRFQFDFTSTMPKAACREEIEKLGGKFHIIPTFDWRNPKPYCDAMLKIMKEGNYDVVHTHELFHSGITLKLAYKAGIPCRFVHAHNWQDGDGTNKKRSLVRTAYNSVMRKQINKYSTVQCACSTWAGRFLYGEETLSKASYNLLFNSVDTSKFIEQYDLVESNELKEDGWKNIINVARVSLVKNQVFLVEIAENLRDRGEKIRILCAGSGDEEAVKQVNSMIREKQLEDYIEMLGVRRDIDSLMRKCDAFILPSLYEGMPLVLIEAQASGLPCVIADTFSREVDYGIGLINWLKLEEGVETWTDAVVNAVNTPRALKSDVVSSIEQNGFDSKIFTQKLCNLYEEDYLKRVNSRSND